MATHGLPDLDFVLLNGYDITGIVTHLDDEIVNDTEDHTAAAQDIGWEDFVGTQEATINISGFYDSTFASARLTPHGSISVLNYSLAGNVVGMPVEGCAGVLGQNYQRIIEQRGISKENHVFQTQAKLERAEMVANLVQRGAAGNGDAQNVDSGASSANGCAVFFQVSQLALGGYTNLSLTARHSTTNGTGHVLITGMTQTFTDIGAVRLATAPMTINRYLSFAWAWTGSGSGMSATFIVGIVRL